MKKITYKNVHNRFRLNGTYLNREDLLQVGYSLVKEGDEFEKSIGDFLLDWFDDKSYVEIHTSGTTGVPKIIKANKQAMVNSALATGDFFELSPGDKALYCLPTRYISGKMMLVRSIILGLDVDFVQPTSKPLHKSTKKYDFAAMAPLQAQNSLEELKNVKKLIIGGSRVSKSLEDDLKKLYKTEIFETYGMTETLSHIAAKKLGESAFTILPNISISQNENKCLVIDAPKVAKEIVVTNDMVELINDKQFKYLGRTDNVVNSGGIKLIPEQIEEKLAKFIDTPFFVGGVADASLGEKLVLVIEGKEKTLDTEIFNELDKYQKPKEVFFVSKFTQTENSKNKRKEILASLN